MIVHQDQPQPARQLLGQHTFDAAGQGGFRLVYWNDHTDDGLFHR